MSMIEVKYQKYKRYMKFIKFILINIGLWPTVHPILAKIIIALSSLLFVFIAMCTWNSCIKNVSNVLLFGKSIALATSFSLVIAKITCFLMYYNDFLYLKNHLSVMYEKDLEKTENRPYLLHSSKIYIFITYFQAATLAISLLMYSVKPIVAAIKFGKYIRTYTIIYPFKFEPGGPVHWVMYGVEFMYCIFAWTYITGFDNVYGMFSLQISGEFRLLAKQFKELYDTPNYNEHIKDSVTRHQLLMLSKTKLQRLFGFITICLAVTSALTMCSIIFQMSLALEAKAGVGPIIHMIFYLSLKLGQVYTFAWYGHNITQESDNCLHSIYNSQWSNYLTKRYKNDILIVLLQKPMVLIANGCMAIQLDMFGKVVNTAVSYFFLLQTMKEKSEQY